LSKIARMQTLMVLQLPTIWPTAVHKSLQYSAPALHDVVGGFLSGHKGQSTIGVRDVYKFSVKNALEGDGG
jgi:hypothetical protein